MGSGPRNVKGREQALVTSWGSGVSGLVSVRTSGRERRYAVNIRDGGFRDGDLVYSVVASTLFSVVQGNGARQCVRGCAAGYLGVGRGSSTDRGMTLHAVWR